MKKIFVLLVTVMFCCGFQVKAQINYNSEQKPTTEEEYNYLTKGYKIQIENGLDMKQGYSLVDISPEDGFGMSFKDPQKGTIIRSVKYKALIREGEKKPCAILCIMQRKDTGYTEYICIPSANAPAEMWEKTVRAYESVSEMWKEVNLVALSKLVALLSFFLE